jgi:ATP-binding cassette subfamily F protein 3
VGYFSQAHEGLHPDWTLVKEIQNAAPAMLEPEARSYLAKFLFTGDDVFKQVNVLSGGERGRLALACLALQGANLLLLDEPTNHLDLPSQEILQRVIADFRGTVLLVSHDRYLVDAVATQVWEVLPSEKTLRTFVGNYSQMRAEQREQENRAKGKISGNKAEKPLAHRQEKKKSINPRTLRDLEEKISRLEEELEIISGKLENPLEAVESISELGEQYNTLKKALDEMWNEWESIFSD